jgi:hypothetical protein
MEESDHMATAEIITTADSTPSPNGFGASVDQAPGLVVGPLVLVAAAFAGGLLLAMLVRRSDS